MEKLHERGEKMSQFGFLVGEEPQNDQENQEIKQELFTESTMKSTENHGDTNQYDPFPDKPGHEEWNQVLYVAVNTMDSEVYNLFLTLRHKGIAIRKEVKQEGRNRLKVYSIYRGDVGSDEFKGVIVPQYLEPNRDKIKAVLKLAAFEGEFVECPGINFEVNKEVVAGAVKKYLPRLIEAKYGNYSQGIKLDDGREIWVVCEREPGSDRTEITWEEFYVLCWLQDIGKLTPGPDGMASGVRRREV